MSADPVGAAWASLGMRRAELEVVVEGRLAAPAPSAAAWRGAPGRAAHETGSAGVARLVVPDAGLPGLWFEGWDALEASEGASLALRLHVVEAGRELWPRVLELLDRLRVRGGRIRLKGVGWRTENGRVEGSAFGPPVSPLLPEVAMPSAVRVVAEAPVQLTRHGTPERGIPSWKVLVRSAGERLRQQRGFVRARTGLPRPPGAPGGVGSSSSSGA